MKPFATLDEVYNTRTLATTAPREDADAKGDFQPLFTAVALGDGRPEGAAPPVGETAQIELVEGSGRVQQIIVKCRCGEHAVLDCSY
jgi:hypothetical protein